MSSVVSIIKDISESVKNTTDIIKEPIHNLTLKPTQEIGNGLADIFYLVFSPFKVGKILAENKIGQFQNQISANIDKIPIEKRIDPPLNIVGPAIEAAKFHIEDDNIREMFAKLIASAVNIDNVDINHPAFVEVIKQLSSLEASIFKVLIESKGLLGLASLVSKNLSEIGEEYVVKYFFPFNEIDVHNYKKFDVAIENLIRLQMIEVPLKTSFASKQLYDTLKIHRLHAQITKQQKELNKNHVIEFVERYWCITDFGENLAKLCL